MPRSSKDLAGTAVLALLLSGPRRIGDMHRTLLDAPSDGTTGLPRSAYRAVERLVSDELIRIAGPAGSVTRPDRAAYELTEAGRAELLGRVRELLESPSPDATLTVTALQLIGCLPPVEAAAALWTRSDALAARCAELRRPHAEPAAASRLLRVETEFEFARCDAEREWVSGLAADIDAGRLDWPTDVTSMVALVRSDAGALTSA